MIPASLLPALGATGGAGLGGLLGAGGLGQLLAPLDYPRRALTAPFAGGDTGLSLLPGAAGLLTGVGAAMMPGLLPFAPLLGAGAAGGTQALFEALYPEQVKSLSTPQVTGALGLDPENFLANMAVGAATDPLMYAGALGGLGAGRAASSAVNEIEQMGQAAALAEQQAQQSNVLRQAIQGPYEEFLGAASRPAKAPWLQELEMNLAKGPTSSYRPDVVGVQPDPLAGRVGSQLYKQVQPQLASDLGAMGLGQPIPGTTSALVNKPLPGFAQTRGGWLQPTAGRQMMLGGEVPPLTHPAAVGPVVPDYMSTLDEPMLNFMAQRQQAGLMGPVTGTPGAAPPPVPSLGAVQPELAQSLYSQYPDMMYPSAAGKMGHAVDLPMDQALASLPPSDVLAQAAQDPTLMQELVMRLGLVKRPPFMNPYGG